jgi:glycosyltransferase involved in cell wall biosynthesis
MAERRTAKTIAICKIGYNKSRYPDDGIKRRLKELGHKVIEYIGDERDNFLLKVRHFQVYEGFLSFCEKNNVDIAFFDVLVCPEHLLADLKVKGDDFKTKIVFLSTFREPARSPARANVFKELIENKYVSKALMFSILGNKFDTPQYWKDMDIDENKFELLGEPLISEVYDETKPLIEDVDLPKDKKIGLFFGRDDPSKGLDDLTKTLDLLDEDVHIFIVAHGSDYTEERAFNIEKENSSVVYRCVDNSEIVDVFNKVDFVILPYRKSYEFGGSGIIKIAVDLNKPVIVPDLYPFNEIIKDYKIGVTFEPENYLDLAKTIDFVSEFYDSIKKGADFRGYENILSTYDSLADKVVE